MLSNTYEVRSAEATSCVSGLEEIMSGPLSSGELSEAVLNELDDCSESDSEDEDDVEELEEFVVELSLDIEASLAS